MIGFIQVNKHKACHIWVNVTHIVYLYDYRIELDNGETKIVDETAFEMLADIEGITVEEMAYEMIADIEASTKEINGN